jgi:quercetin dioxygenase-like cupin family protein
MTWFSSSMTLKASAPDLGAIELSMVPGDEPPLHVHSREDEWFYLLEGEITFHVGGEDLHGSAGSFVFVPRGIAHTFTVETPNARFLLFNTPGGFERMFERNPQSIEQAAVALVDFGMDIVGPHPRELEATA